MDQFMNITLGKKIARNWVLGCFLLAMDAILSALKIFAVKYVSCRTVKTGRKYS